MNHLIMLHVHKDRTDAPTLVDVAKENRRDWKGLGRVRLGGLLNFKKQNKNKETRLRSFIPLLISFSQPNSFAQRKMAVARLARMNRLFLSKSEYHLHFVR